MKQFYREGFGLRFAFQEKEAPITKMMMDKKGRSSKSYSSGIAIGFQSLAQQSFSLWQ